MMLVVLPTTVEELLLSEGAEVILLEGAVVILIERAGVVVVDEAMVILVELAVVTPEEFAAGVVLLVLVEAVVVLSDKSGIYYFFADQTKTFTLNQTIFIIVC